MTAKLVFLHQAPKQQIHPRRICATVVLGPIKDFQLKVQVHEHQMTPLEQDPAEEGRDFQCQVHNHNRECQALKREARVLQVQVQDLIQKTRWEALVQIAICR